MAQRATFTATGKALATICSSKSVLRGALFDNANAAKAYIQVFDAVSGSVTLGTTVPKLVIPVAASECLRLDGLSVQLDGVGLSTAVTTTPTGSTLVTTDGMLSVLYE